MKDVLIMIAVEDDGRHDKMSAVKDYAGHQLS